MEQRKNRKETDAERIFENCVISRLKFSLFPLKKERKSGESETLKKRE
jgi:hypothetical protein